MRELLLRAILYLLLALTMAFSPIAFVVCWLSRWLKKTADTLDIELLIAQAKRKTAKRARTDRGGK